MAAFFRWLFVEDYQGRNFLIYGVAFAWLWGVIVSFNNGNRKLPGVALLLGIGLLIGIFTRFLGMYGLAGLAILAAIIWIANKADMS